MGMIADLFVKLGLKSDDFNKGIDQAKGKTTLFTNAVTDSGNKIAGVFGSSLDAIKSKITAFSAGLASLVGAFKFAAEGGQAAADATKALEVANEGVTAAQAAQEAAQAALTALQATGAASAEELAFAEGQVAVTSGATTAAIGAQAVAQGVLTTATGFGTIAMNIFKLAIASTGIGLLVLAVAGLVAYFTSTREGAKMIKVAFAEIGAVVTVLRDRLSSFGEVFVKLFQMDWAGAAKAFRESFSGIGDEIVKEASAAGDLAKRQGENNKLERESIVLQQERKTKIAQLRQEAKEENKTAGERIALLDEAKKLIIEHGKLEQRIAKENAAIGIAKRGMHKESTDELKEDQEDRAKVLRLQELEAQELKALSKEYKAASAARKKEIEDELALQDAVNKTLSTPMTAKDDTGYGKKLGTTMKDDGTFQDNTPKQKEYDHTASFQDINKDSAMGELKVPGLDMKGIERSKAAIQAYIETLKGSRAQMKENLDKINSIVGSAMDTMTESIISGFAKMAMGMKPKDFGKELLGIIGHFMVTLGMAMILISDTYKAFKKSLETGGVASFGLGVALVVAGTVLSNVMAAGPGGSASSAGGAPATSSGYSSSGSSGSSAINGNVTFEVHGSTLKGVLNNQDRRNLSFG